MYMGTGFMGIVRSDTIGQRCVSSIFSLDVGGQSDAISIGALVTWALQKQVAEH